MELVAGKQVKVRLKRGTGTVRLLRCVTDYVGKLWDAVVLDGTFNYVVHGGGVRASGDVICFRPEDILGVA